MIDRRSAWLWSSLAIAIAASVWSVASPLDDDVDGEAARLPSPLALARDTAPPTPPEVRAGERTAAASAPTPLDSAPEGRKRNDNAERNNIFAAYSWEPPKPVAASVKEPPRAPPVPFVFAGRLEAGGAPTYILAEGARMHVVAVGEQVGEFRLQQASAGALVFLHVASNLTTTLSIAQ